MALAMYDCVDCDLAKYSVTGADLPGDTEPAGGVSAHEIPRSRVSVPDHAGDAFSVSDFDLPDELSAHAPSEARGVPRDRVRMLVGRRAGLELSHHLAADLPRVLRPGDLLVVNDSGTLPAALEGVLPDGDRVAVHVSGGRPIRGSGPGADGPGAGGEHLEHLVELRRPQGSATAPFTAATSPARPGLVVALPGAAALELTGAFTSRLWYARFRLPGRGGEPGARTGSDGKAVAAYLAGHGKPIRYSYVDRDWPLSAYQTAFAVEPGSSEMPSAARPFTPELVTALVSRGVLIAPITLHTGVASPEAHEAPYAERFRVPQSTARLVNHVRTNGGRVVAIGTTVVRALESAAADDGTVRAADGWTELVITPRRGVRAVDGLLTGWHEPRASHLMMLEAVAGRPLLDLCYAEAIREGYLWHEFGDVNLLLCSARD